jgi:hypothetical protein
MVLPPWAAVKLEDGEVGDASEPEEEGEVGDASEPKEEVGDASEPAEEDDDEEEEEVVDANEPAVIMALCSPCPVCMKEYTIKKLIHHHHRYLVLIPLQNPTSYYEQFRDSTDPHRDTLAVVKALHQVQHCVFSLPACVPSRRSPSSGTSEPRPGGLALTARLLQGFPIPHPLGFCFARRCTRKSSI